LQVSSSSSSRPVAQGLVIPGITAAPAGQEDEEVCIWYRLIVQGHKQRQL
jgi:hypothetical protein